jgi:hypothetical protein
MHVLEEHQIAHGAVRVMGMKDPRRNTRGKRINGAVLVGVAKCQIGYGAPELGI